MLGEQQRVVAALAQGRDVDLDDGQAVVEIDAEAPRLALRLILGRLNQAKDFEEFYLNELWIETARGNGIWQVVEVSEGELVEDAEAEALSNPRS